ncbi:MAG: T9SS type A sorting domain-containing protein [Melioribacteraceae bacterium]|nr:T9SS type A sorting domain-containing protein [Melioribacteraceae bacterium]
MLKKYLLILFYLFLFGDSISAQFAFSVETNKIKYEYGETILVKSLLTNICDTSVTIFFGSQQSCQAEFQLDDFQSWMWTICLPTVEEVVFSPGRTRIYNWSIDPKIYGLPESNGIHELISVISFRVSSYFNTPAQTLSDTTYFEAPKYLGGQLHVDFPTESDSLLYSLKDSLNVEVLDRWDLSPTVNVINEIWQIYGHALDSLILELENDYRIKSVEYNRMITYDSITVTSITQEPRQIMDFYLSDSYPNPFNATSRFYIEIPHEDRVNIILYNSLGETVSLIFRGTLSSNVRYAFEIDGSNLSSGVYYYSVISSNYQKTKKVLLLR